MSDMKVVDHNILYTSSYIVVRKLTQLHRQCNIFIPLNKNSRYRSLTPNFIELQKDPEKRKNGTFPS